LDGVGGGDLNATFFWTSLAVAVTTLVFVFLELRPAESGSARGEFERAGRGDAAPLLRGVGVGVGEEYGGVGVEVEEDE
jgi:hypothetical protein